MLCLLLGHLMGVVFNVPDCAIPIYLGVVFSLGLVVAWLFRQDIFDLFDSARLMVRKSRQKEARRLEDVTTEHVRDLKKTGVFRDVEYDAREKVITGSLKKRPVFRMEVRIVSDVDDPDSDSDQ